MATQMIKNNGTSHAPSTITLYMQISLLNIINESTKVQISLAQQANPRFLCLLSVGLVIQYTLNQC